MRGFTKTGQPIQGRRYIIAQEPDVPPTEVKLVGKMYGPGGNAELVGIIVELVDGDEAGGRGSFPWPLEASDGAEPIRFEAAP